MAPQIIIVRRGKELIAKTAPNNVISKIKNGEILATDEISVDGKKWVQVQNQRQLAQYLKKSYPAKAEGTEGSRFPSQNHSPNLKQPEKTQPSSKISKSFSKKMILTSFFLVLIIGWLYALPYITIFQIKTAITEKDPVALSQHIDFVALKQSIKNQLNARVIEGSVKENKENPFALLGIALANKLIETIVEVYVSPTGIEALMRGKPIKNPKNQSTKNDAITSNSNKPIFENASLGYKSFSTFTIQNENAKGNTVVLIFTRSGLSWKLTDIRLSTNQLPELKQN